MLSKADSINQECSQSIHHLLPPEEKFWVIGQQLPKSTKPQFMKLPLGSVPVISI